MVAISLPVVVLLRMRAAAPASAPRRLIGRGGSGARADRAARRRPVRRALSDLRRFGHRGCFEPERGPRDTDI